LYIFLFLFRSTKVKFEKLKKKSTCLPRVWIVISIPLRSAVAAQPQFPNTLTRLCYFTMSTVSRLIWSFKFPSLTSPDSSHHPLLLRTVIIYSPSVFLLWVIVLVIVVHLLHRRIFVIFSEFFSVYPLPSYTFPLLVLSQMFSFQKKSNISMFRCILYLPQGCHSSPSSSVLEVYYYENNRQSAYGDVNSVTFFPMRRRLKLKGNSRLDRLLIYERIDTFSGILQAVYRQHRNTATSLRFGGNERWWIAGRRYRLNHTEHTGTSLLMPPFCQISSHRLCYHYSSLFLQSSFPFYISCQYERSYVITFVLFLYTFIL